MTRKKLSDTEQTFLTGDRAAPSAMPEALEVQSKLIPTDDAMSQILSPPPESKEASTRFTADLPDSLHERLSMAALKAKKTKVQLVREILNQVLPE